MLIAAVDPDTPEPAAGATADETDEWVTPMPDFLCEGEMGIRNKDICCAVSAFVAICSVFRSCLWY